MQQVPTVEEYSDEENDQSASSAASSASSEGDSDHEGTQSSHTGSSQFVKDTPTTSPASTRIFVHGHGGREDEESEGSEEASEDESDEAHVPASDITRTTAVGYELLANKLSETPKKTSKFLRKGGNVVPIYRKFEHLNHRVLLHLQDEVCEMEEELRYLDESINQISPRNETGHAFPASRRGDARYGSDLHYKRTELLGRIFQKLGQYNQALTTFNGLSKDLDPASVEDIQAYRAWIEKRTPVDNAETRFLDRKNDLLAISRRPSVGPMHGGQQQPPIVWLPLVLVLPILAFAIVPSLLGRLVVITLIGAAGLRQVTSTPELMSYMTIQEWSIAAAV
ncbi:hypothetical protein SNOG_03100 [Parastagonospora nodorum SN15]|uniref:DUF6594 domain-containing protein n=1 Tax=Phaeosphaeria nodorum (strain SN15 / ATCC MYA-4574 / FGSC 10173) TaxID=321614 RepID=Q0UYR4_PHANO|nr:hypothetical protein SNOG_03100 [Parastagonospora nodorum SN15]EAT89831.2 hypothetical protein SNOG_03100 [Parastagonospora nodorum SN15]